MASFTITRFASTFSLVNIKYSDLCSKISLSDKVYQAFGREGLGLILISDIPRVSSTHQKLLQQSVNLPKLPQSEKNKLISPLTGYKLGLNESKTPFGEVQVSFTANPEEDSFGDLPFQNMWPHSLPYLRSLFRDLGQNLIETTLQLSNHIDAFLDMHFPYSVLSRFENTISSNHGHLATLTHSRVFSNTPEQEIMRASQHLFTILLPPVYYSEDGTLEEGENLLKVRTEQDDFPVSVNDDSVCFLIGKAGQRLSEDLFESKNFVECHDEKNKKLIRSSFVLNLSHPGDLLPVRRSGSLSAKMHVNIH